MKTTAKVAPQVFGNAHEFQAEKMYQLKQAKKRREAEKQTRTPPAGFINPDNQSTHYTGQELRPYDGRPGSLDHLDIPSRAGNRLLYRSRQGIQTIHEARIGAGAV